MSVPARIYQTYFLTAGESDAEGRMPITLLTKRIIEIATIHANALGIGYSNMIEKNVGWVLSRLSIEMLRYPGINEEYTLSTWIESYNRRFSERNFAITTPSGKVLGYARSLWVPMDFAKRTVADLSLFDSSKIQILDDVCDMAKPRRTGVLPEDAREEKYIFKYSDLDFNRHVNTVRYISLLMDLWPLERYDANIIKRLDIAFHLECRFGDEVVLREANDNYGSHLCEIVNAGTRAVSAIFDWA